MDKGISLEARYYAYSRIGKLIEMKRADSRERRLGMPEWITLNAEDEDTPRLPGIYISLPRSKPRDPVVIDTRTKVV